MWQMDTPEFTAVQDKIAEVKYIIAPSAEVSPSVCLRSVGLLAGEKSKSPLFPMDEGTVVTNDWCINLW